MITKEVIDALYKRYPNSPQDATCLNMALLFENTTGRHNVAIDMENERLTIGSVATASPFRRIALRCINAIVLFEEWVAIVMHSSIIFLNRHSSDVSIHIKPFEGSWFEKLRRVCAL